MKIPSFKEVKNLKCENDCRQEIQKNIYDDFLLKYIFKDQRKEVNKKAEIISKDSLIYGSYVQDSLKFLAYDPNDRKSLITFLKQ